MDRSELLRRLPEIDFIQGSMRRETINVFLEHCPTYFWYKPASSTGKHHPPDQHGRHGLLYHTKRSFVAQERLARSLFFQDLIDVGDVNHLRAAILLHDLFKYGSGGRYTVSNHDVLAAQVFQRCTDLPEAVVELVETHNGPDGWCAGPAPRNVVEQVHHQADMIASCRQARFAVHNPCEELVEEFTDQTDENGEPLPDIESCELEEWLP